MSDLEVFNMKDGCSGKPSFFLLLTVIYYVSGIAHSGQPSLATSINPSVVNTICDSSFHYIYVAVQNFH